MSGSPPPSKIMIIRHAEKPPNPPNKTGPWDVQLDGKPGDGKSLIVQGWQRAGNARKRRAFAEAAQWVNAQGTNYPFSFDSVCDALEIDCEVLRSRLRALTMGLVNAARNSVGRLRLKELSRAQHVSVNRLRRRGQVPALLANS